MQFTYVAYNQADGIVKGRIEADNEGDARSTVTYQGYKLLKMAPSRGLPGLELLFPSLYNVGSVELVRFARQVATMLESGGNLLRALEMAESESKNKMMRRTLGSLRSTLNEGESLTSGLAKHPKIFNPLFVSVVDVGEHTGRLAPSLEQLADMLEQEREVKQRAIKTMMYPMAIMGLSVVTLAVLMIVAVPPLLQVFEQMGANVPVTTRLAVAMVNAVKDNILNMFIGLVAVVGLSMVMRRTRGRRRMLDLLWAKMPLLGPLTVAGDLSRLSRTMAMLLEAGVPLATALQLAISGCKNIVIREVFEQAEESLMNGHGLTNALRNSSVLPSLFVELTLMGEESNTLQRMMNDAGIAYQKQRDQRLDVLLGVLEPASTLIVGGIVGFIAFSMFVPIHSGLDALG